MRDAKYDAKFAVGITAASSTIGPIIPPSLPIVIYGVVAGARIGPLFFAGFIPGLMMAASLMIMNLTLLAVGCFMETVAAITIMMLVLLPIAVILGIDPVHFGVTMVLNLMLGLLTPPVGMVLYVLSRVARIPFEQCVVGTAPFLVPLVIVLLLITFVPGITL